METTVMMVMKASERFDQRYLKAILRGKLREERAEDNIKRAPSENKA